MQSHYSEIIVEAVWHAGILIEADSTRIVDWDGRHSEPRRYQEELSEKALDGKTYNVSRDLVPYGDQSSDSHRVINS